MMDAVREKAYRIYKGMKRRCGNPNYYNFHRYGGRGIKVLVSHADFISWYVQQAQGRTDLTVDRIDNDSHYELDNLQLVTRLENVRKAHRESQAMKNTQQKARYSSIAVRSRQVRIGEMVFQSIADAGRHFSPTDQPRYIANRIRAGGSKLPDGTLIEVLT